MIIRHARMSDADRLFRWRNDPVTCASFRSTAAVPREDHARWMAMNVGVGYPSHIVLIGEEKGGPVGVARFDMMGNDVLSYEASITIDPQWRGQGFGRELLGLACEFISEGCTNGEATINAEIRTGNTPSRRMFEANGFKRVGRRDGFVNYRRTPQ